MKTNYFIISIISAIVFLAVIQTVNAQSVDNFRKYTNNDFGFTIDHPSKWKPEGYFD
jgi:hypothetical protein